MTCRNSTATQSVWLLSVGGTHSAPFGLASSLPGVTSRTGSLAHLGLGVGEPPAGWAQTASS